MSARVRRTLFVGVIAAFVAALTVGNAAAATPNLHRMHVNPVLTPAPSAGSTSAGTNYLLRTCQVGLSIPGSQCYDPYQMRTAYGVDSLIANGWDGTGKTIVIIDAFDDPSLQSGFDTFNNYYGLPDPTIAQYYPGGQANTPPDLGWSEEMQLDVDWSHAIAPGANIVMVHGKSNSDDDLVAAANYAIDNNLGDVISMSFGESDQCLGASLQSQWHQAFVNATKKGMTLFASSGDQGAAQPSCDGNSWIQSSSSPASDPLVTGVGGTELNAADFSCLLTTAGCGSSPAPGTWLGETGWNEGPTWRLLGLLRNDRGERGRVQHRLEGACLPAGDDPRRQDARRSGRRVQRCDPARRARLSAPVRWLVPLRRHELWFAAVGCSDGHRRPGSRSRLRLHQRRSVQGRPEQRSSTRRPSTTSRKDRTTRSSSTATTTRWTSPASTPERVGTPSRVSARRRRVDSSLSSQRSGRQARATRRSTTRSNG